MTTYRCPRCGERKAREAFGNDMGGPNGRRRQCKACERMLSRNRPNGFTGNRRQLYMPTFRQEVEAYPELAPPPVLAPDGRRIDG